MILENKTFKLFSRPAEFSLVHQFPTHAKHETFFQYVFCSSYWYFPFFFQLTFHTFVLVYCLWFGFVLMTIKLNINTWVHSLFHCFSHCVFGLLFHSFLLSARNLILYMCSCVCLKVNEPQDFDSLCLSRRSVCAMFWLNEWMSEWLAKTKWITLVILTFQNRFSILRKKNTQLEPDPISPSKAIVWTHRRTTAHTSKPILSFLYTWCS